MVAGRVACLLQADGDARSDQVEGLALAGGGLGEQGHSGPAAWEADLITGKDGQVADQTGEAPVGVACRPRWRGDIGKKGSTKQTAPEQAVLRRSTASDSPATGSE